MALGGRLTLARGGALCQFALQVRCTMTESPQTVFLLDDEESVVVALGRMLRADGFTVQTWTSATEFLDKHDAQAAGCLVTDVRMPEMDGLELQRALAERQIHRPIIFITGRGDIPTTVQGMKGGAVTFLAKPIERIVLRAAISEAIARDGAERAHNREQREISQRLASLTPRERQVLDLVMAGLLNKQIAAELGAAEKTVKVHRGHIMEKMHVRRATELVSLLSRAEPVVLREFSTYRRLELAVAQQCSAQVTDGGHRDRYNDEARYWHNSERGPDSIAEWLQPPT